MPAYTVCPASMRRRAVSRPRLLFAPVMSVVVMPPRCALGEGTPYAPLVPPPLVRSAGRWGHGRVRRCAAHLARPHATGGGGPARRPRSPCAGAAEGGARRARRRERRVHRPA